VGDTGDHQRHLIRDQFTRQAAPFAAAHARDAGDTVRLLAAAARVGPTDDVLDVACGPGLVACALAPAARHVTGIDLTPAMIDQARARQQAANLHNLAWAVGDVLALPFAADTFSVVVTRFSLHHLPEPRAALAEMARVARPGGRVAVADVFTSSPEQAAAYDQLERWRDPSHVHALMLDELTALARDAGLGGVTTAFSGYEVELEQLLARSFPGPGDADRIRRALADDVGVDRLGVGATRRGGVLYFTFPVAVVAGTKCAR
jgi:SAM-dependent methyltransferase